MAEIYQASGKLSESEELYKKALTSYERSLGAKHLSVGSTLHSLGLLYLEQGRYDEAEHALLRSVKSWETTGGGDSAETATRLVHLGLVYSLQEKASESRHLLDRTLAILERDGEDANVWPDVLLENLADLSFRNGNLSKAGQLYRRVLEQRRAHLDATHLALLGPLTALGSIHYSQNDYKMAEKHFWPALEIAERTRGAEHPDTATCLTNLATVLGMRKQLSSAEPLYRRALTIWEKSLPQGDPRIRLAIENLAVLYTRWGKQSQASNFYDRLRGMGVQVASGAAAEKGRGSLYTVPLKDLLRQTSSTKGFDALHR